MPAASVDACTFIASVLHLPCQVLLHPRLVNVIALDDLVLHLL